MSQPEQLRAASRPSFVTHLRELVIQTPLVVRVIVVLCVLLYANTHLFGIAFAGVADLDHVCMCAKWVVRDKQIYRLLTASFYHVNFFHLLFNMLAFYNMGCRLERLIGTLAHLWLLLLFSVICDIAIVILSAAFCYNPIYEFCTFYKQCSVGFSGVIFGLIVLESYLSRQEFVTMFGFFSVPSKLYPWALLILCQLIFANVSFIGHLCGLLTGYLFVGHYLDWLILPRRVLAWLERSFLFHWMTRFDCFVLHREDELPISTPDERPAQFSVMAWLRFFRDSFRNTGSSSAEGVSDTRSRPLPPHEAQAALMGGVASSEQGLDMDTQDSQGGRFGGQGHVLGTHEPSDY